MPEEITKYEEKDDGIELSEAKRQQHYREALNSISQAITWGWRADLQTAYSLFNIEHNKLHDIDGVTFADLTEKIGISKRSVQRYRQIAERIREVIKSESGARSLPGFITQRDFNNAFEPFFANGKQATLRGLSTAAKNFETFRAYLDGSKDVDDKDAVKLLNAGNRKTREQIEREEREAKMRSEIDADQAYLYRTEAASRGYTWDEDEHTYNNQDGSPLTDKQMTEFTTSVDALRMLTQTESALLDVKNEVERITKSYADAFHRYKKHANDNAFHIKAREKHQTNLRIIKQIEDQLTLGFIGEENS